MCEDFIQDSSSPLGWLRGSRENLSRKKSIFSVDGTLVLSHLEGSEFLLGGKQHWEMQVSWRAGERTLKSTLRLGDLVLPVPTSCASQPDSYILRMERLPIASFVNVSQVEDSDEEKLKREHHEALGRPSGCVYKGVVSLRFHPNSAEMSTVSFCLKSVKTPTHHFQT